VGGGPEGMASMVDTNPCVGKGFLNTMVVMRKVGWVDC
jgi:hypothetical protein